MLFHVAINIENSLKRFVLLLFMEETKNSTGLEQCEDEKIMADFSF